MPWPEIDELKATIGTGSARDALILAKVALSFIPTESLVHAAGARAFAIVVSLTFGALASMGAAAAANVVTSATASSSVRNLSLKAVSFGFPLTGMRMTADTGP